MTASWLVWISCFNTTWIVVASDGAGRISYHSDNERSSLCASRTRPIVPCMDSKDPLDSEATFFMQQKAEMIAILPNSVTLQSLVAKPISTAVEDTIETSNDDGHMPDSTYWWTGIILTIFGQTVCVLGLQLQKISHIIHTPRYAPLSPSRGSLLAFAGTPTALDKDTKDLTDESSLYFTQWRWMIGGLVWLLGHITCWCALGLAPQSILACLQSWNIIANLAMAPYMLGEVIPQQAIPYSCLLVSGCLMVVRFGPKPEEYGLQTVNSLAGAFIDPDSLALHAFCAGLFFVAGAGLWLMKVARYVVMSATTAWYATLCSKSMAMLLMTTVVSSSSDPVEDRSQVKSWGFYAFVFFFVVFAIGQVHFMNMALKYGRACSVIPMYEGLSLTGQVLFGGICFQEFHHFRGRDVYGFMPGVICVLLSLVLFVQLAHDEDTDDDVKLEADSGAAASHTNEAQRAS